MAKITETEQWDNEIYRLETTDPVEGGEDGVDNKPHKNLANRTVWLKAQITAVQNTISNFSFAALAGSATQKFKVAAAFAADEAVNKSQMESFLNQFGLKLSTDGKSIIKTDGSNIKSQATAWMALDDNDTDVDTIDDSFNISSMTRQSTYGYFRFYFDTPMDNDKYAVLGLMTSNDGSDNIMVMSLRTKTTSYFEIDSRGITGSAQSDNHPQSVSVLGGKS